MTVLAVTGSTGRVGGLVARRLGPAVGRLVVRDATRAPHVEGDPEVVEATYGDLAASRRALEGVDVLFMVSAAESPVRREEHRTFIDAAAQAGVGQIVYTSFAGAAADAIFTLGRDHHDAEQAVRASGMAWTFLRDSFYSDFFPLFAGEDGVVRGPAGEGRVAAVARADVADVAVEVLRDPARYAGETCTLTGPEAFSVREACARMTAALGHPFSYVEETVEEAYASRRRWSTQPWQLDAWVSTYLAIGSGELAAVSPDVERITGHAPRTLEQALS
ncbi:SDR family oxidoreductase [Microlunatus spumicola]|uniref:SDR family oxidoreductase n=1 Tax=Microlunatus spumicola TaxID=81499 RepID=A0ABP6XI64_9ACTN